MCNLQSCLVLKLKLFTPTKEVGGANNPFFICKSLVHVTGLKNNEFFWPLAEDLRHYSSLKRPEGCNRLLWYLFLSPEAELNYVHTELCSYCQNT